MRNIIIGDSLLIDIKAESGKIRTLISVLKNMGYDSLEIIEINDGGGGTGRLGHRGKGKEISMQKHIPNVIKPLDDGRSVGEKKVRITGGGHRETFPPGGGYI